MTTAPTHLIHPHSHRRAVEVVLIVLLSILAGGFVLTAGLEDSTSSNTVVGSGNVVSQERVVPEFSAIDLAGTSAVTVRAGERQQVVVRTDDNLMKDVTTEVRQGELVIGDGPRNFRTSGTMVTEITVPYLAAVGLSGTGAMVIHAVDSERFVVNLAGTGTVTVDGRVDWLKARLPGSGQLEVAGLRARHMTAAVKGTGTIVVGTTGSLESSVSGTGSVVRR
jgi:hypothetical protein